MEPRWNLAVQEGRVKDEVWKWIQSAKVMVVLEAKTANGLLGLSSDAQRVFLVFTNPWAVRIDPLRFKRCTCIIGKDSFTERFYFEVQPLSEEWAVGATYSNASTTIVPSSNEVWSIGIKSKTFLVYGASARPIAKQVPKLLGVHVNHNNGTVAFYNVETQEVIIVLSHGQMFSRPVVPFFYGVSFTADPNLFLLKNS